MARLKLSTRGRSYYDLLGVSPTATSDEIRRAYLQLMKRHHPDAASGSETESLAPVLNRCYAVLKNPAKRAEYDSRIALGPSGVQRSQRVAPRARHGPTRRFAFNALAIALVALVVLTFIPERMFRESLAPSVGATFEVAPPQHGSVLTALPSSAGSQRLVDLAGASSLGEAERFSRECFVAARVGRGSADHCILFDLAFLYSQPPTITSVSAYFNDDFVASRHREAVAAFGLNAEKRLAALREAGFSASIERIRMMRPKPQQVPPPGSATSQSRIAQGTRERSADERIP